MEVLLVGEKVGESENQCLGRYLKLLGRRHYLYKSHNTHSILFSGPEDERGL